MKKFSFTLVLLGSIGLSGLSANQVESGLELQWSPDLNHWQGVPVRVDMLSGDGLIRTGTIHTYADWTADGYRLPTEAEREYVCRAGTATAFNTGAITYTGGSPTDPNLDRAGWYMGNSDWRTHPVRQKEPNAWGLYDMHGNVWEWCWNFQESYTSSARTDPRGPTSGTNRIRRGGSWTHDAQRARSAHRVFSGPFNRFNYAGFRPVLSVEQ